MQYVTRGTKILIAEGDRTVLEMIQIRLEVAGYHALTARTGQQAIEVMRHSRPAILITEVNLPDMSGLELMEIARDVYRGAFPMVVMGKQLGSDDIRRAIRLGARDCLAKPFSGADVLDRVGRLLKKQAAAPTPAKAAVWV